MSTRPSFLQDISETIAFAEHQYEQKTGRKLILFNEARDKIINTQELSATLFSNASERAYIDARIGPPNEDEDTISCYHYPNSTSSLKMITGLAILPVIGIGFTVLGVICMTYAGSGWKVLLPICALIFFWCACLFICSGIVNLCSTCDDRSGKKRIHKNLSTKRKKILQAFSQTPVSNDYSVMFETFLHHHLSITDILQSIIDQRTGPGNPLNQELPQDIKYLLFLKLYLKEVNRQQMHFRRTKNARYTQCEQIV